MRLRAAALSSLSALCLSGCLWADPSPNELRVFSRAGERPRSTLILFTIDSVRAEHLGAYGYHRPTSPVFDELSARGLRFEHAYAQAPHTSFSITSLLTGRYFGPLSRMQPGLHLPTLAHRLRQAGYTTAAIYPPAVSVTDPAILAPFRNEHFGFQHVRCDYISANDSVSEAIRFLSEARPPRAFVWVHVFEPHEPYEAGGAPEFGDHAGDRYDQELVVVDAALGRLVRYLQAERPEAQIVVTADHGEAFNDHGESLHGTNLYEEQIRVPLVLAGPGIPAGVYRDPVQLVDIAPTLLQLAGNTAPATLDGHTLLSAQPGAARGSQLAVSGLASQYALIAWPWKLTRELRTDETKLYDLAADPGETQDQSQAQAATRLRLRGELARWLDARLRAAGDLAVEPRRPTPKAAILRGRMGDVGATSGLRDLLATTGDDALRLQAARLLLRLPDPPDKRGLPPLPAVAASTILLPADELQAALAVLSLRAGQRALAPMVHAISRSPHHDPELRLRATEALALLRDARALPALLALLDLFQAQGEYRSCREVIAALARLRDRRAVPALVSRLDNVMVQLEVIAALDAIAAPESVRPLVELLANSQRVPNRIAAATTLGRIGRGRARRALLQAAHHDPEPPVRTAAKAALAAHPAIKSGAWPPTR